MPDQEAVTASEREERQRRVEDAVHSNEDEFIDPYLDPQTEILRNLVGARVREALDDAEGSLSFARLVQLMDRPPGSDRRALRGD